MCSSPTKLPKTALLLLAAVSFASIAMGEELKLAHFMPPSHTLHQEVFQPLADALDEATGGALTIRIYPAGALGKGPVQQYKRAVEGVADITFCIHSYTTDRFPASQLITLPGLVSTAEAGTAQTVGHLSRPSGKRVSGGQAAGTVGHVANCADPPAPSPCDPQGRGRHESAHQFTDGIPGDPGLGWGCPWRCPSPKLTMP